VGDLQTSTVATAIQMTAMLVVTVLFWILLASFRRPFLRYWAWGWACLTTALLALVVEFVRDRAAELFFPVYCLAEYGFGYLLAAGCRNLARSTPADRRLAWLLIPAAVLASVLTLWTGGKIEGMLIVHMSVMTAFVVLAFWELMPMRHGPRSGPGLYVMLVALAGLAVEIAQYVPLCAYAYWTGAMGAFPHLKYASLIDLLLETLLAFGMVMVVMETVRRELEAVNRELRLATAHLQSLAQRDPLTEALNRNAFNALVEERKRVAPESFTGCVAVIDMDGLKPINDTLGHAAGDAAIQLVARTVRSLVRPNDMVFRWGGDEFLILWLGIKEADARSRLDRLNAGLAQAVAQSAVKLPADLSASWGVSGFESLGELDGAIERADRRMYDAKKLSRVRREPPGPPG
jgi:diguanylate cyclase (GGDEF)-like protein